MFGLEVYWLNSWWGSTGVLVGVFGVPLVATIFPFLYWAKEGFSLMYFVIWAAGLVGIVLASIERKKRKSGPDTRTVGQKLSDLER